MYGLLSQDGTTFHIHRNHLTPFHAKEPHLYPHLCIFIRISDSNVSDFPKFNKQANSDSFPLIPGTQL